MSDFLISMITKIAKNWYFREILSLYPILDDHKIKTRANFENPKGKSLDLHLMM